MTVFGDPLEVTTSDVHSEGEFRFLSLGNSEAGRLLVVAIRSGKAGSESSAHGRQLPRNDANMSQEPARNDDDLQPEYDFSGGVRGKHFEAYRRGTNVVFLDPDVAAIFKDSAAVNTALRLLLTLAREQAANE
jgi:hypothetical protein